jgi:DNA-binding FadR family transcriptional regulator
LDSLLVNQCAMLETNPHPATPSNPIRDFLLTALASGHLEVGSRLPAERELAARFSVPRSAVRKALVPLEHEGWIVRHVGRGTFVANGRGHDSAFAETEPDISPAELIEARLAFEPYLAELVIANAAGTDFAAIRTCLKQLKQASKVEEFEQCDAAFHQAIANATRNALVIRIYEMINRARQNATWGKLKGHTGTPELRYLYNAEHDAILNALLQRDAEMARQRIVEHLVHIRRRMLGY